jgi:hypothetical protein
MFTTDVGDGVDALEQPAAAGRKRRRTSVPENPTGAAKGGMEATREALKKRDKHLHPPDAIPLPYQWGGS